MSSEVVAPERSTGPVSAVSTRVANLLVQALCDASVEVVFGLPGGAISPVHDALLGHGRIRTVTTRHEADAAFAAAGYAKVTGKLGVVVVTSGPGVLNCMTGLASARCENLPLLILAGEVARERFGRNSIQDGSAHGLDVVSVSRPLAKETFEVRDAGSAVAAIHRAIALALAPPRGPVLVTLPIDVNVSAAKPGRVEVPRSMTRVPEATVARIDALMRTAERPLIFAGTECAVGEVPALLRRMAEHYQIPVATTPAAKGAFAESHPLSVGVYGWGGHASAKDYVHGGVDVLFAVGNDLTEAATNGWSPLLAPSRALIQACADPAQLCRTYAATDAIAVGAGSLIAQLLEQALPQDRVRRTFGVRRNEDATQILGPDGRLAPQRVLWELQSVLPADTIYTLDLGEHMLFGIHHLHIDRADSFVFMLGLGSMGSGIGAALGAKVAHPDRPVVAICGDGGFAMSMSSVAAAVSQRIPAVFAVLNDEGYGMVEKGHTTVYGRRPNYEARLEDIAAFGRSMGADALTIRKPGEILALEGLGASRARPLVLDIHIDQKVLAPSSNRNQTLSQKTQILN